MDSIADNNKRVAKNTLFLYIRMFFIMGITLYTSRIVLNALGVVDYGIWNVVGGVVSMVSFLSTSIANGFQRFFNIALGKNDHNKLQSYFNTSVVIEVLLIVLAFVILESIGLWFVNNKMTIPDGRLVAANWVYQCSIFIFLITLIQAPFNAVIIAYERMDTFAYISIVEAIGKLGIALLIKVLLFDKLIVYSILHVLFSLVVLGGYVFFAVKCNNALRIRRYFNKMELCEMLGFSGWNLFGSLAHMLKGNGLNIVLNLFFTPAVNAARGVAYQVSTAISSFSASFLTASRPQIIKYYAQENYSAMNDLAFRISRYSFCLLWSISLPIVSNIDLIMRIWLGDGLPPLAPKFCVIVIATTLVESFAAPIATLVHASGKMKIFQIVVSSVILLIVPIAYLFLRFGASPQTALYVSLVIVTIAQVVRLLIVRRILPFSIRSYIKRVILPCVLVVALSSIIPFYLRSYVDGDKGIISIIISIVCVIVTVFFIGLTNSERSLLIRKSELLVHMLWKKKE